MYIKETPQEQQNRIYRKMSASKKLKIVDDFYKFARKLQQDKDPKVRIVLDDQDSEIIKNKRTA